MEFALGSLELFGWIGGTHSLSLLGDATSWLSVCFGLERTHSSWWMVIVDGCFMVVDATFMRLDHSLDIWMLSISCDLLLGAS